VAAQNDLAGRSLPTPGLDKILAIYACLQAGEILDRNYKLGSLKAR